MFWTPSSGGKVNEPSAKSALKSMHQAMSMRSSVFRQRATTGQSLTPVDDRGFRLGKTQKKPQKTLTFLSREK
jgi:hypothetical protein